MNENEFYFLNEYENLFCERKTKMLIDWLV